jgi:peptidoglycan/LPS O-acetylase OafA/YrhL
MRAVAVLTVFANHLFDWPPGGFVGVDVFFVISGFFITGILIRERATTGKVSFQNFYVRRVKRILPSALLVLTVTVVGAYILFPATRAKETLLDALYAAVFASNFRFESVGADYFQQNLPPSPLQHYWSLSIEEQFYFVWPALLIAIFALTRSRKRRGQRWARQWSLLGAMSVVAGLSFAWAMYLSVEDPNRAYFSSLGRVWELGIGALMAIAGPWLVRIPAAVRPLLAYLGLAGVVASLFLIDSTVTFPAPWAALPVLSTALIVGAFHGGEVRGMFVLTNPVSRYLGDTSYTLYLWHWPVIVLLASLIPRSTAYYVVVVVVSVGLTALTYHFYEDPIRKSSWLRDPPVDANRRNRMMKPAIWGLVGGVTAAMVVVAIVGIGYRDTLSAAQQEIAAAPGSEGPASDLNFRADEPDPCFGAPAMLNGQCALRNVGTPLRPSIDDFATDLPREAGQCYTLSYQELLTCDYGYRGEDATRIALVGDSHATLLLPPLKKILNANKWRVTTYTGHQCAFIDPAPEGCQEAMAQTREALLADPYDLVLFANYNGDQDPSGYVSAWAPIVNAGSRILALADNPESSEEAIACLTRVNFGEDRTGECGTPRADAFRRPDALVTASKLVAGSTALDLSPYYCTADRCPSVIGNVIVYRDTNHITATFAETLAQPLEDGLRSALKPR